MRSWRKRPPLFEYPARRIALIKPSSLGDIVHSLPVLTALRQRYPVATITWIVNRSYEALLRDHPDLDATLAFDRTAARGGVLRFLTSHARFLRECRRQKFDLVVDLQGLLRSGLMTAVCGAERCVGLSNAREGARCFYTDVLEVRDGQAMHAVERYWLVAEAFGVGAGPKQFRLAVQPMERVWALETLHAFPRPWLACAVGARWMTKRWPPESFAALARMAQERFGGTVLFVGSAEDAPLSQRTAAQLNGAHLDLTGKTTLPRLVALLSEVDAMLANDTGPLHLAAARGRPVVAPYTCTQARRTGPYASKAGLTAAAVETRVWCQGSCLKCCDRLDCMNELTPERLWPALFAVLSEWESRRRSA